MKHALRILGLGLLLVPAAFSQTVILGSPCVCQIQCNDGTTVQYTNTTVAYCCKQFADLCGEDGNASCAFADGRVRYCTL